MHSHNPALIPPFSNHCSRQQRVSPPIYTPETGSVCVVSDQTPHGIAYERTHVVGLFSMQAPNSFKQVASLTFQDGKLVNSVYPHGGRFCDTCFVARAIQTLESTSPSHSPDTGPGLPRP